MQCTYIELAVGNRRVPRLEIIFKIKNVLFLIQVSSSAGEISYNMIDAIMCTRARATRYFIRYYYARCATRANVWMRFKTTIMRCDACAKIGEKNKIRGAAISGENIIALPFSRDNIICVKSVKIKINKKIEEKKPRAYISIYCYNILLYNHHYTTGYILLSEWNMNAFSLPFFRRSKLLRRTRCGLFRPTFSVGSKT